MLVSDFCFLVLLSLHVQVGRCGSIT
uniref:Uncharacterized protein n=1 Tax=Nelumbo nucifera TaxID=4432 RepID=A0A822XPI2_NELNU|nr:TPA_asm: hypothetical protein HUJ06_022289 [Nelumbo nucifera]